MLALAAFLLAGNGGYAALVTAAANPDAPDFAQTETPTRHFAPPPPQAMSSACGSLRDTTVGSLTGSATYDACNSDTISISANQFPTSSADRQYNVQREVCGDGEVIVKVLSVSGGMAGLELRADNAPGAKKVGLRTALGNLAQRFGRTTTDAAQSSGNVIAGGHRWLKVVRSGSSVSVYTSTNGSNWNFAATYTISLPDCVQATLFMQSINANTTHTGVFNNLQFSGFTNPEGDPTTVAFDQDTISADAGDTVMICVNIVNPCICSPTEVDVELQGSGSPHLSGYSTETLVFEDTTEQLCFPLVISGAAGSANYTLSLEHVSGGNGAEAGTPASLIIAVTGIDDGSPLYCGVAPLMSNSAFPNETPIAFDRFGNEYVYSQLITQAGGGSSSFGPSENLGFSGCNCSDVGIDLDLFDLWFEDCSFDTGSGFAATGQTGEERRRAMCAVFQYLESIITLNPSICNPNGPRRVNVRIQPSIPVSNYFGEPLPGFNNERVLGYASPYFPRLYYNPGIAHTIPQIIINSGEYPQFASENTMHGMIRMNFDFNWNLDYNTPTPASTPLAPIHDFFTVGLHEALHMLGFVSSFTIPGGLRGSTNSNNSGLYFSFDQFLFLDRNGGESLILNDSPTDNFPLSPLWRFNAAINPATDMHQSCLGGSTGPDMEFTGIGDSYPIYTDESFQAGSSFSHLEGACDLTQPDPPTIPYVMNPSLPRSTDRRTLHAHELDIMSRIGYSIGEDDCAVGAAPDGNSHSCGDFEYVLQICPPTPGTISIPLADLLENDPNATEVAYISPILGSGTGALNAAGTHYEFTTSQLGQAQLVYAIVGCNGELGNLSTIQIDVSLLNNSNCIFTCPDLASCEEITNFQHCYEWHECGELDALSPCNLICNSELCGTIARNAPINSFMGVQYSQFIFENNTQVSGWVRTSGGSDYFHRREDNENSYIQFNSNPINPGGFMTFTQMQAEQQYLLKFTAPIDPTFSIVTPGDRFTVGLIQGESLTPGQAFNNGLPWPAIYNGPVFNIFDQPVASNGNSYGMCYSISEQDWQAFTAFWVNIAPSLLGDGHSFTFDNFEVIADNFTAGPDLSTAFCNEPVQLDGEFCMLSGVGVLYEWLRVEPDGQGGETLTPVASYRVLNGQVSNITGNIDPVTLQLTVAPAQTTTYRLRRSIYEYGGLPTTFDFCNTEPDGTVTTDCNSEDDVTVFVSVPLPDAHFTFSETDCVFDFTSSDDTPGLEHEWTFGNTGQISMVMNPTGIVLPNGTHTITHEVTGICGVDTYSETITVDGCCITSLTGAFSYTTDGCDKVYFTALDEDAGDFLHIWTFGDGNGSSEINPEYAYMNPGTYLVVHTILSDCGVPYATTQEVTVTGALPEVTISAEEDETNCELFYFTATGAADTYSWTFPDNTTGTGASTDFEFSGPGIYEVKLTATNECGQTAETIQVVVTSCDPLACCPVGAVELTGNLSLEDVIEAELLDENGTTEDICINGTLTIDVANYVFSSNTITLTANSSIIIQASSSVAINLATLEGCDFLWENIQVEAGGVLSVRSSTIRGALYAIEARNGAKISVTTSTFENNYVGIWVPALENNQTVIHSITDNDFLFTAQTLKPLSTVFGPIPIFPISFSGIEVNNVDFVVSGPSPAEPSDDPLNAAATNRFKGLYCGIRAFNSNLIVSGAQFEDIEEIPGAGPNLTSAGIYFKGPGGSLLQTGYGDQQFTDNPPGSQIATPAFINCSTGIEVIQGHAQISGNRMLDMYTGIRLREGINRDIQVRDNYIEAAWEGITATINSPSLNFVLEENRIEIGTESIAGNAGIGIYEASVPNGSARVSNNDINGWARNGIFVQKVSKWQILENLVINRFANGEGINLLGSQNSTIKCNRIGGANIDNGRRGLNVENSPELIIDCNDSYGFDTGIRFAGTSTSTTLSGNTVTDNNIGLHLDLAIFNKQEHRGNIWMGSFGSNGARFDFIDFGDVQAAQFFVDDVNDGAFLMPPNPVPGIGVWFISEAGETYICDTLENACISGITPDFAPEETDVLVASGGILHPVLKWIAEKDLYRKMQKDSGFGAAINLYSNFKSSKVNTPVGKFYGLYQDMEAAFAANFSQQILYGEGQEDLWNLLDSMTAVTTALLTATGMDSAALVVIRDNLFTNIAAKAVILDSLYALFLANRRAIADTLLLQNAAISVQKLYESNEKAVADIFLSAIVKEAGSFSSLQEKTLQAIASQCPWVGGDAVYAARSLYRLIEPQSVFDDDVLCGRESIPQPMAQEESQPQAIAELNLQKEQVSPENLDVVVYPNPTQDVIHIAFSGQPEGLVETRLFTLQGRPVDRRTFGAPNSNFSLSTQHLPSGMYFLQIHIGGQLITTTRIAIIR
jgi:PKD repeat protein